MTRRLRPLAVVGLVAAGLTALVVPGAGTDDRAAVVAAHEGDRSPSTLEGTSRVRPDAPRPLPDPVLLGAIDEWQAGEGEVSLTGWVADRRGGPVGELELVVDGAARFVVPTTPRPDVSAAHGVDAVGFAATFRVGPGGHRACVRSVATGVVGACARVAGTDHLGVIVTPNGVTLPVLDQTDDGWLVTTPCSNERVIRAGRHVRTAQIVIDPGHGGFESSTVASNGLTEKALNLAVALRLRDNLTELGYSVVMTRTFDTTVPLAKRSAIANAVDPDLFVSVHHNGGALSYQSVPGTQVFYDSDEPESRRVSGILYEELYAAALPLGARWRGTALDGVSTRLTSAGIDYYGLHRGTPDVVSVITEWMWLDNPAEAALLIRPEIQQLEADALARGIDRWYRTLDAGSGFYGPWVDDYSAGSVTACTDPPLR